MMKTAIVYDSKHHGNTLKLVKALSAKYDMELIPAQAPHITDLSQYELIGFASGIDFGRFYNTVETFLKNNLPERKHVFFLYTCAQKSRRFTDSIRKEAEKKDAVILGEYGCRGYNTYGPWKLIGGMNKGHPNGEEIQDAFFFYKSVYKQLSK